MPQTAISHLKAVLFLFLTFGLEIMVESPKSFGLRHIFLRGWVHHSNVNVEWQSEILKIGAKHLTRLANMSTLCDVVALRSVCLERWSLSAWGESEDGGVEWERSNLNKSSEVSMALKTKS